MPYYGTSQTGGGSGTNDHRLLAGRLDANQHPAAAIAVMPGDTLAATTVQAALDELAARPVGGGDDTEADVERIAHTTVNAYRVAVFRADGRVELASPTNPAHVNRIAGITLTSATAGQTVRLRAARTVRFEGWAWTPGLPVFLGANGTPTQTPPSAGFLQRLGHASAPDILTINIETPITRD